MKRLGERAFLMAAVLLILVSSLSAAGTASRLLQATVDVPAPVQEVWEVWTTREGLQSFLGPQANVDLRVDGLFEILFYPENPPGRRGAEGLRILVVEPYRRFGFTWNAPISQPVTRAQRTQVFVELEGRPEWAGSKTRVTLTHQGFGRGPEWDETYRYFDAAWRASVLPRLVYRFRHGPVDWTKEMKLPPVGGDSLGRRVQLVADPPPGRDR